MAKIFRLQDNVPDVYSRKSRDFQLLCNVFDIMQGGVKYDIDTITSVIDTRYCSEKLLPLLQSKLGFFTEKHLNSYELRTVLTSFTQLCRDKGCVKGIREAIELYLKVIGASRKSRINITNAVREGVTNRILHNSSYIVEVLIEGQITDITLLTELLRYVLPAGYKLKYSFYQSLDATEYIVERGTVNIIIASAAVNNRVAGHFAEDIDRTLLKYVFATGMIDKDKTYYTYDGENETYSDILGSKIIENESPIEESTVIEQVAVFEEVRYGADYPVAYDDTAGNFVGTKPYYKGKDLSAEWSYSELLEEGIISNLFTEAAVSNVFVIREDGMKIKYLDSVKVNEEFFFENLDLYYVTTSEWSDYETPIIDDDVYGVALYSLTTQRDKLGGLELFTCKCIYNKAGVPLDVSETYYTLKANLKNEEIGYRFTALNQTYYALDETIIAAPSSVSTALVADSATTINFSDGELEISSSDTEAGYVLELLEDSNDNKT